MNDVIIGRVDEKNELHEIFMSKEAEFLAVYGRRRVGKTFLIKSYFRAKKCTFFYALGTMHGSLRQQLKNFTDEIANVFYAGAPLKPAESWMDAYKLLTEAIGKFCKSKKVVLFFDELPWMATHRSKLLQALSYYWNRYWSDNSKLKLVVCGSASSWIIRKIIKSKGGLHNRVTRKMLIEPYSLYEVKRYLKHLNINLNNKQVVEAYMTFGGVPFYLKQLKKGLSVSQSINRLCFNRKAALFNEFDKLFHSLFDEADTYIELIRLIARNPAGLKRKQIETKAKLTRKGGTLTKRLEQLEETGFILSFIPLGKEKGIYYKVVDEYVLFYLTWIEPILESLNKLDAKANYWKGNYKTPKWYTWVGHAFEAVCYKHIPAIRAALSIPDGAIIGTWQHTPRQLEKSSGAQIDLLFDRRDDCITICEIKFTEKPFAIDKQYAKNLVNKTTIYKDKTRTNKQIFIAFIASSGLKQTMYSEELVDGVVTLEDLFKI